MLDRCVHTLSLVPITHVEYKQYQASTYTVHMYCSVCHLPVTKRKESTRHNLHHLSMFIQLGEVDLRAAQDSQDFYTDAGPGGGGGARFVLYR